jgi:cellulose biosynthesis protein BcsQ
LNYSSVNKNNNRINLQEDDHKEREAKKIAEGEVNLLKGERYVLFYLIFERIIDRKYQSFRTGISDNVVLQAIAQQGATSFIYDLNCPFQLKYYEELQAKSNSNL